MLISIAIFMIVVGALFEQFDRAQRNAKGEQIRVDTFQEARDFVDQMTRDMRNMGYPNVRNFDARIDTCDAANGRAQCIENAVGLVKLSATELWFEGSLDGSGTVYVVRYRLNDCNGVPCLQRGQTPKQHGDPLNGQIDPFPYQTQVENVANGNEAIFTAYSPVGTQLAPTSTKPSISLLDSDLVTINSIAVRLQVRSKYSDPRTNEYPVVSLLSTVKLNNCIDGSKGGTGGVPIVNCD
jgi:hypothetical protein